MKKVERTKKSQISEVLRYLKENGSITSMLAIQLFGATRLSGIIYNLRKEGYNIKTVKKPGINRYGNHNTYAEYVLEKKGSNDNG